MLVSKNLSDPKLISLLQQGAIGILPADTVYGVVCRAEDEVAVKKLYKLKNREQKPGTVIAASIEQLENLGIKRRYLTAVEQFWPGAISVVVPSEPKLQYLDRGLYSIPVRIPKHPELLSLLRKAGPLLTSSANKPGEPPANSIKEAKAYFGEEVDFYVDGDDLSDAKPSTIIRVIDDAVEVLREGAVKIDEETGRVLK